jgi:hypothetical protein
MRTHRFFSQEVAVCTDRCHRIDFLDKSVKADRIDAITSIDVAMLIKIRSPRELGLLVRAARKTQQLRMDDVAGSTGVGHVFVREVERGKPTVQLGRVMKLLAELGIKLEADAPADVMPEFSRLQSVGVKPLPARRRGSRVGGRRDDAAST